MNLIDRDAAYAEAYDLVHYKAAIEAEEYDAIINILDNMPIIDAVEVVRCKDCVSVIENEVKGYCCVNQLCPVYSRFVEPDFSCICGERRCT